ncbi:hypothetical protein G7046_g2808 [Stylonectria norvegica]|nr:hypothetical protein G7046_g2808 [Stylonectria norvegica]
MYHPHSPTSKLRWTRPEVLPSVSITPAPPCGDLIETVKRESLCPTVAIKHARISDVEFVASYNWVDDGSPKIIVPGKPARWAPLKTPRWLPWDSGKYYRDLNAASCPSHPLEPAIVSIMRMKPDPEPVDIVACGSTVGNLLRFVRGQDTDRQFRMLAEVVGETVHLIRRENSPTELIPDLTGFGHTFPKYYTTWENDVNKSVSHQRILKYQFGGLHLMVRFQGDGYIKPTSRKTSPKPPGGKADDCTDLLARLSELELGSSEEGHQIESPEFKVVEGGEVIPQEAVFDLKTRAHYKVDDDTLGDQLPRLWVAQVEQLIVAYHKHHKFEQIDTKNVKDDVEGWEEGNQVSLVRLVALLQLIIAQAKKSEEKKIEIVVSPGDCFEIRKQLPDAGSVLSDSVRAEWSSWLERGSGTKRQNSPYDDPEDYSDYEGPPSGSDSDDSFKDLTACDKECGYCGKCPYE